MPVKFSSGPQIMDGRTALMYARTRHADNDFGRNQRQQQVLMAIFDAIRAKGFLSQLTSIDDYTAALRDAIRTDLSHSQLLWLAQVGSQLDAGAIQRYAINSRMIIVLDEYENFAADPAAVHQIIDEMTAGGTGAP
jgi:anionic cell wall polymer biosynthesis LytR-Cps2A-Psr (LCP) family protein